jgi:hypothetical protein
MMHGVFGFTGNKQTQRRPPSRAVLARPHPSEGRTAHNMRFAASVAIRSLRQTLRSVTAIAGKRNRRAFAAGSQTAGR